MTSDGPFAVFHDAIEDPLAKVVKRVTSTVKARVMEPIRAMVDDIVGISLLNQWRGVTKKIPKQWSIHGMSVGRRVLIELLTAEASLGRGWFWKRSELFKIIESVPFLLSLQKRYRLLA